MATENLDPKTHRLVHTSEGVVGVPREQKGVPIKEYFRNIDMPQDISKAVIYATEKGPILSEPDRSEWTQEHDKNAEFLSSLLKDVIDEHGYYSKMLKSFATDLSRAKSLSFQETKAAISQSFEDQFGKTPQNYLEDQRRERGLPVRERNALNYARNGLSQEQS